MTSTATLLVSCPDQKGLVAALAQVLYGHGANILDSDQHVDPQVGQFFQRIRFDMSELRTDRISLEAAVTLGWERWVGSDGLAIGIDDYGFSAPASVIAEKIGFTGPAVADRVQGFLG